MTSALAAARVAFSTAGLTAGQLGLIRYVRCWSESSLAQARLEPFAVRHLSPAIQEAVRQGHVEGTCVPIFAATSYVRRAQTYETSLLRSLGLDEDAANILVEGRFPYADYFSDVRHPWQEEHRSARQTVGEMETLHEVIAQAFSTVQVWKRNLGFRTHDAGRFDVRSVIGDSVGDLQDLLVDRIETARRTRAAAAGDAAIGLDLYFDRNTRRHSGIVAAASSTEKYIYDTTPPPAA